MRRLRQSVQPVRVTLQTPQIRVRQGSYVQVSLLRAELQTEEQHQESHPSQAPGKGVVLLRGVVLRNKAVVCLVEIGKL